MVRLRFLESRGPALATLGPHVQEVTGGNFSAKREEEVRAARPAGVGGFGLFGDVCVRRARLCPSGGPVVSPGVGLHRKLRAGGCCRPPEPGHRAHLGRAGGEASAAPAGGQTLHALPRTLLQSRRESPAGASTPASPGNGGKEGRDLGGWLLGSAPQSFRFRMAEVKGLLAAVTQKS